MTAIDYRTGDLPEPQVPERQAGLKRSYPTLRTTMALVLREMGTKYGNSPGGYIWALLNPMIMVIVVTVMFSLLGRQPRYGDSFLMYYASGHLVFQIFQQVQNATTASLRYSSSLLQFPVVTWIDAIAARFILNTLTSTIVYFILLYGIAFVTGENMRFEIFVLFEAIVLSSVVGLGFGTLTCYLFMEVKLLRNIWRFASRPLFIASGVLFMYEDFPDFIQDILYWNPLIHVVSYARSGIFELYRPNWISHFYVWTFALVTLTLGMLLLRKHHRRLLFGDE